MEKPEKHLQSLEIQTWNNCYQLGAKDTKAQGLVNEVSSLRKKTTDTTGELDFFNVQNVTDNTLCEEVRTLSALHDKTSQQHLSNYVNESKKLVAECASVDVAFQTYRADLDSRVPGSQIVLKSRANRANHEAKDRKRLFVVEKGVEVQKRRKKDDSKELEGLQYIVDSSIARERRAQNTVTSLQSQF